MKTKSHFQPLTEGAAKFIKTLGSPDKFNWFVIEALEWSHQYQLGLSIKSEADDPHYFLLRLLEHPLSRWMEERERISSEDLGMAFAEISIAFGYNDICAELANVMIMCARNIKVDSVKDSIALHNHFNVLHALFEMAEKIKVYQEQTKN